MSRKKLTLLSLSTLFSVLTLYYVLVLNKDLLYRIVDC